MRDNARCGDCPVLPVYGASAATRGPETVHGAESVDGAFRIRLK
ncbi:hypothetical protein PM085_02895 [Halorubrum ezzemoulense]|uniref:Uncharacterized protein n=1 Tax=Halorubrum ezzemoulense TaxID=337243 RepID=A0ABT4YZV2_HALEZ|nr:hypothetical protein [Halorubrum ezzemoulense]MDB2291237.1 hypothetical protein [Halorubrum ezzemoulense]